MTASRSPEIAFATRASTDPVPAAERDRILASPGFGEVFTDHMVTLRWTADQGWHDGAVQPYGPLMLEPATAVFHYAQEIFEGLKAYRQGGGPIVAFRPQANAARFNRSATRLAMPELPEAAFLRSIELLVSTGPRLGPGSRGAQPVPAPVHDRDAARAGREPAVPGVPVHGHRVAGRGLLHRRRPAGLGVAVARVHPRRARRHRRGQVRRQLRGRVRRAAPGHRRPAATRWSGWTRWSAAGSRKWAG